MIPHSRQDQDLKGELDRLDASLNKFKIEFDKFFNGASPIPPEDLKTRIENQLKQLRSRNLRAFADQFRLSALEARFNSINELCNRRLRELDHASRQIDSRDRERQKAVDPFAGFALETGGDSRETRALYRELYRSSGRERKVDFDTFQRYLENTVEDLKSKAGCDRIHLRVIGTGNRLKLKARPIRDSASENEKGT